MKWKRVKISNIEDEPKIEIPIPDLGKNDISQLSITEDGKERAFLVANFRSVNEGHLVTLSLVNAVLSRLSSASAKSSSLPKILAAVPTSLSPKAGSTCSCCLSKSYLSGGLASFFLFCYFCLSLFLYCFLGFLSFYLVFMCFFCSHNEMGNLRVLAALIGGFSLAKFNPAATATGVEIASTILFFFTFHAAICCAVTATVIAQQLNFKTDTDKPFPNAILLMLYERIPRQELKIPKVM